MTTHFSEQLCDTYGLDKESLPAAYQSFLEKIESYNGKTTHGFMGYEEDEPLVVNFTTPWLLEEVEVFEDNDIDREENPTLVPLLQIDPHEANFLLVDVGQDACPVVIWEHETGEFEEISPSLKEFLAKLK